MLSNYGYVVYNFNLQALCSVYLNSAKIHLTFSLACDVTRNESQLASARAHCRLPAIIYLRVLNRLSAAKSARRSHQSDFLGAQTSYFGSSAFVIQRARTSEGALNRRWAIARQRGSVCIGVKHGRVCDRCMLFDVQAKFSQPGDDCFCCCYCSLW